jgi:hypothetical protein
MSDFGAQVLAGVSTEDARRETLEMWDSLEINRKKEYPDNHGELMLKALEELAQAFMHPNPKI